MNRRTLLKTLGLGAIAAAGGLAWRYWPREGLFNPCLTGGLPRHLANDERLLSAWEGIDARQFRDCHVHLVGLGDGGSGAWVNPAMRQPAAPLRHAQFRLYLNAACADDAEGAVDRVYVERLWRLAEELPEGARLLLLAFDWHHDEDGRRDSARSTFYLPNERAAAVAAAHPERFDWVASIHPYREDAVQALERAMAAGARAIKWLPPAQGIDPASPRCDAFYQALQRHDLPLISHAGHELAVDAEESQRLGNPLRLRRALENGVRVIVAHCASLGLGADLDRGEGAAQVANFDLFARMMDEPEWHGRLFGEISAMTQINRMGRPLRTLLRRQDWHHRLVNGSDYPLPAVMPVVSLQALADLGYLDGNRIDLLAQVRQHNALLFDFFCKRFLRSDGNRLDAQVFESRAVFDPQTGGQSG